MSYNGGNSDTKSSCFESPQRVSTSQSKTRYAALMAPSQTPEQALMNKTVQIRPSTQQSDYRSLANTMTIKRFGRSTFGKCQPEPENSYSMIPSIQRCDVVKKLNKQSCSISVQEMKRPVSELDYRVPDDHIDVSNKLGKRFTASRFDRRVYKKPSLWEHTDRTCAMPGPTVYKIQTFEPTPIVIYKRDRLTYMDDHIKEHKKNQNSPNKYEPKRVQDRILGMGNLKLKDKRILPFEADCGTDSASRVPGSKYPITDMQVIKTRSPKWHYKQETDMEKALKKRKWEKTNQPNPASYDNIQSFTRCSTSPSVLKTEFKKAKRLCFIDQVKTQKQKLPAPSHYNPSDSIIVKPMRKF